MHKSLLPPKSDFVFKRIFGDVRNTDILADFLQSVLTIPVEDYLEVSVVDPNFTKDYEDDKLGILDVKVRTKSGRTIDVEIQQWAFKNIEERILFYTSKMLLEQIDEGDNYVKIQQVISILITNYPLYGTDTAYHHRFKLHDDENGISFTDKLEVHTLELTKLPSADDCTRLYEWLKFLKVETREELDMIATENPTINKAKGVLLQMSEDERARMLYDQRMRYEMDMRALMLDARLEGEARGEARGEIKGIAEGKAEVVQIMLRRGKSITDIADDTGLSLSVVQTLIKQ
ncbi:MAG: Rpn family recombination-promoting nuclease/putative transposase [Oscillospiraceae bacterium]|jgi:predicted transposase/invertase (TIGR01784 family)|nr:Rpn family recombination-promoting nuclease/putative transposase [Oscillospiraceae bacterium]